MHASKILQNEIVLFNVLVLNCILKSKNLLILWNYCDSVAKIPNTLIDMLFSKKEQS